MGITIHYQGKLNRPNLADAFCDELADIAKAMEWKYTLINDGPDEKPFPVKGIIITPHEKSEPLVFTFDPEGNLRNAFMLQFLGEEPDLTWYNHTKTQFAPIEVHIAIIKLLKYLRKKYLKNLKINDEGSYWDTGNAELLKKKLDFLSAKLDILANVLNNLPVDKDDSAETIADKIEEFLKRMPQSNFKRIKRKI
jgi:hypothetical protein